MTRIQQGRKPDDPREQGPDHTPHHDIYISLLLLVVTLAAYGQVRNYGFVDYDDRAYVSENPNVRTGLTSHGVVWAFTSGSAGNWFPLTWLSHMADCQIFGLRGGPPHLINLLLHALNSILLFALLKRMTGARWRSAFVACLFALHPLHVESVAWVAERKDVLCALFWFLTLWAYLRYVERPGPGRYLLVLAPFCFGLMTKPMIVTLPFVLLLLDVWPLRRIAIAESTAGGNRKIKTRPAQETKVPITRLLREKAPLFALSAGVSVVTYVVQQRWGSVVSLDSLPIATRLGNALISCIAYILKMFWPTRLAVFYPHPLALPAWQVLAAGLAVAGISVLALRSVRRIPYLAVGWFWYLGTLAPVVGLVQVGMQSRADRYTYLPLIGIFVILAWGAADIVQRRPQAGPALAGLAAAACAACLVLTWYQVQHWKDSASLFEHAIEVTAGNYVAHNGLGVALNEQGRTDKAIPHFLEAVKIRPRYPDAYANLGNALLKQGRMEEAVAPLSEALRLKPSPEAHLNLGTVMYALGRLSDSIDHYSRALELQPNSVEAHSALGAALAEQGRTVEALDHLHEAVRIKPDSVEAHYNLGWVLAGLGRTDEAIAQFSETVRLQPGHAVARYSLGTMLAGRGRFEEAVVQFTEAVRLRPAYADAHFNLGSALANLGRIDEAIAHFSEALRIRPDFAEARHSLDYALSLRAKSPKR